MQEIYRFLDYELNTVTHTLTRKRKPVGLRPKSVATLEYLIANRKRIVSKDEILDAIWPDVCVQEQAVFQSVSELRTLFRGMRSIDTVRGQGYQWILPLADQPGPNIAHRPIRIRRWAAACAALVIMATLWLDFEAKNQALDITLHPVASAGISEQSLPFAASVDELLLQQLRRFGWGAMQSGEAGRNTGGIDVEIQIEPLDDRAVLSFEFKSTSGVESGRIVGETLLGAVRDFAFELHETASFHTTGHVDAHHLSRLFRRAKAHIGREEFSIAAAYLTVIVNELPDHAGAMTVLAYTYSQMERIDDALQWGNAAYAATEHAGAPAQHTDRMMTARLLSSVHLKAGRPEEASRFAYEALAIATRINDLFIVAEVQEYLGEISIARGEVLLGIEQLTFALKYYASYCPAGEDRVSNRLLALESERLAIKG